MQREHQTHREKNSPEYRAQHTPQAGQNQGCKVCDEPASPSSAAESRTRDENGRPEKRPQVASKDEHEKAVG
jgi:hypothetical protein